MLPRLKRAAHVPVSNSRFPVDRAVDDLLSRAWLVVETNVNYFEDNAHFALVPGTMFAGSMGINLWLQVLGVSRVGRVAGCAGAPSVPHPPRAENPWLEPAQRCRSDA